MHGQMGAPEMPDLEAASGKFVKTLGNVGVQKLEIVVP